MISHARCIWSICVFIQGKIRDARQPIYPNVALFSSAPEVLKNRLSVSPTTTTTTAQTAPVPGAPVVNLRAHKLAALLEAYKADRITPIEYHNQRAKILAETQP